VKIAGFNVAELGNQDEQIAGETGTYRWMAPEVGLVFFLLTF
jgi:hypothetical protein